MALTFSCGHCGKSLTTTDDKAGRKAKCPGCGEVVSVPRLAGDEELDSLDEDVADDGGDSLDDLPAAPSRARSGSDSKTCPMCGAENPRRAKTCSACGEKFEDSEDKQQRESRIIDPGEVISAAWTIYKNELGLVVGSMFVAGIVASIFLIPQIVIQIISNEQVRQGQMPDPALTLLIYALKVPQALVGWFMLIGTSKVLLKVARGQDATIGEIFTGGPFFLKMLGSSIVYNIMFWIGFVLCFFPSVIVALMFWPYVYVLVDENPDGIDCVWRAKEVTQGNWGASFVLALVWFALFIMGFLACGVGLLFTMPLASLMFAVAYCHMTGQRTAA